MRVYDPDIQNYREYQEDEKIGNNWLETREFPIEKLPVLWFVDCLATGNTVARPKKTEQEAWQILSCLAPLYPDGLVVRRYAPTEHQFEELCRQQREA